MDDKRLAAEIERGEALQLVRGLLDELPVGETVPLIRLAGALGRRPAWSPAPLVRVALQIADEIEGSGGPSDAALEELLGCCKVLRAHGVEL